MRPYRPRLIHLCLVSAAMLLAAPLASCRNENKVPRPAPPADKAAEVPLPATLAQGWNESTREAFWFTPQGSQLMPYSWFLALEQVGKRELFRSAANMERLRHIPMPPSKLNPDGLPIGFVRDVGNGQTWLGLTCAACHTAKLKLGAREVIIDGGPTLADFKRFLHDINVSLAATRNDEPTFARFAQRVLGEEMSDSAMAGLRKDLDKTTSDLLLIETQDRTDVPYGYARLDAFGVILNNVAARALGMPENAVGADAPVSFPFVWDAPQADRVQWNGSALNAPKIGGLIRNIGEVLGVFGQLAMTPAAPLALDKGYMNSLKLENLGKIENWLRELWSPAWPADLLPPVDQELARQGKIIYAEQCSSCHSLLESRNPARRFDVTMVPVSKVGTDPTMARNYLERKAKTGILEGQRVMIVAGEKMGPEIRTFQIVINGVVGVLLKHPLVAARVGEEDFLHAQKLAGLAPQSLTSPAMESDGNALVQLKERLQKYSEQLRLFDATTNSYKARPLNGVWATAPYLHNGSVPNLWELLRPPGDRVKLFHVGSREFDPKNIGLKTEPGELTSPFDTSLHGNSNAGHEYGTNLTDGEKWALIEYVKSL
jgi:hypothetical protein